MTSRRASSCLLAPHGPPNCPECSHTHTPPCVTLGYGHTPPCTGAAHLLPWVLKEAAPAPLIPVDRDPPPGPSASWAFAPGRPCPSQGPVLLCLSGLPLGSEACRQAGESETGPSRPPARFAAPTLVLSQESVGALALQPAGPVDGTSPLPAGPASAGKQLQTVLENTERLPLLFRSKTAFEESEAYGPFLEMVGSWGQAIPNAPWPSLCWQAPQSLLVPGARGGGCFCAQQVPGSGGV